MLNHPLIQFATHHPETAHNIRRLLIDARNGQELQGYDYLYTITGVHTASVRDYSAPQYLSLLNAINGLN